MSQENVEMVRQPVALRAHTRRRLEERLAVRFPRAAAFLNRAVFRLPPRSRLRRAIIRRVVQVGTEALNRGDYEAAFGVWDPECEAIFPPRFVTLGVEAGTRGREERVHFQRKWTAEWGELLFEPEEVIDLDSRVLVVGRMKGSGLSSGPTFDNNWAVLLTVSAGRVIREQVFIDHGEALEAAGLSE
ncbi:MAG: nuclear transport factor 2 family protein [Actinomycetota bacterium]